MSYFIFDGIIKRDKPFFIKGKEAKHILKSRRTSAGEELEVLDKSQKRYLARVEEVKGSELALVVIDEIEVVPESNLKIRLYIALIKEKPLDFVIQKTTELGVDEIIVFLSRFSQRFPKGFEIEKKKGKWEKIALEACKQCRRTAPPNIHYQTEFPRFDQRDAQTTQTHEVLVFDASGKDLEQWGRKQSLGSCDLVIGPEGGLDQNEIQESGAEVVRLGPRTLRADTAAVVAVSLFQYRFGDLH